MALCSDYRLVLGHCADGPAEFSVDPFVLYVSGNREHQFADSPWKRYHTTQDSGSALSDHQWQVHLIGHGAEAPLVVSGHRIARGIMHPCGDGRGVDPALSQRLA